MLFLLLLTVFGVIIPDQKTGLISFLDDALRPNALIASSYRSLNSQTMPLLTSATVNESLSSGGGTIALLPDGTLASDFGPSGAVSVNFRSEVTKDQATIYIVKEGDTLSEIAENFGVTTETIIWANDISGETITIGKPLVILPVSGVRHIVEEGDTLRGIAKKYDASLTEIIEFNKLDDDHILAIGQVIDVPNGVISSSSHSQDHEYVATTPAPSSAGYFTNPVPGSVITQGLHGYNAIDFGAPNGTPVVAAASGEVISSRSGGWNGGYGNFIVISHPNGTQTLYSHMSSNSVTVGQKVSQGQTIGYIGSTGRSTGPHLHFEVRGASNPFAK